MMEVVVDVINESVETLMDAEVARAKAQMKAGLLMALESCSSRAADGGLPAMGKLTRIQPRLSDAVGADLAVG
jgi:hypothetical protein